MPAAEALPQEGYYFSLDAGLESLYYLFFGLFSLAGGLASLAGVLMMPEFLFKAVWAGSAGMLLALAFRLLNQARQYVPMYLARHRERFGVVLQPEALWLRLNTGPALLIPRPAITAVKFSRASTQTSLQEHLIEIYWQADGSERNVRLSSLKLTPQDDSWLELMNNPQATGQDSPLMLKFRQWAGERWQDTAKPAA